MNIPLGSLKGFMVQTELETRVGGCFSIYDLSSWLSCNQLALVSPLHCL